MPFTSFELKILSFGDNIKHGVYKLHSSFEKVRNYNCSKEIVSLVLPEIGAGPNNIVVFKIPEVNKIKIFKNKIYFDSLLQKVPGTFFKSKIEKTPDITQEKINFCIKELLRSSPPLSMAFIFDKEREKRFKTKFEKTMLKKMKNAINLFLDNKYTLAAKELSGLGFGLTPSGDDFLAGVILGLGIRNNNDKIKAILKNYKTENLISLNIIRNYSQMRVSQKIKDFIFCLDRYNKKLLKFAIKNIINIGHSSGSDFLSGFLFVLNYK